jgi:hypothetical protein
MLAAPHAPTHQAPEYPAGPFEAPAVGASCDMQLFARHVDIIAAQPTRLRYAVQGLGEQQLATRYRNWTVRQIVHHLADSTVNLYCRWKLALTEVRPTVKPYDESDWAKLPDALLGEHTYSLAMFEGTIGRLTFLARTLSPADCARMVWHPQYQKEMSVAYLAALYAWHGTHHISQIEWLRSHYRW